MATPHLIRIAYASDLHAQLTPSQITCLLSIWRLRNAARAITGVFMHHQGSVFQVLEGYPDAVRALYQTISQDNRHHAVVKLVDETCDQRSFGDWSIGHATRLPYEDPSFRFTHCNEPTARALLAGFTTGPWRRSIC
jgi:hypothetical protein